MNFGQRSKELLLELKRSDFGLPTYNDIGVKNILSEISLHFDELEDQVAAYENAVRQSQKDGDDDDDNDEGEDDDNNNPNNNKENKSSNSRNDNKKKMPMEYRPSMLLHDIAIRRNKRCLLAYHSYRIDKLRALRKESPSCTLPAPIKSLLSEEEINFYVQYDKLLTRYSSAIDLDLFSNINPPSEQLSDYIQVRVIPEDGLGQLVTTSPHHPNSTRTINLDYNTIHYLPRCDVEHLIRQGLLQQLDTEESF